MGFGAVSRFVAFGADIEVTLTLAKSVEYPVVTAAGD